jgi:hypothetical protein
MASSTVKCQFLSMQDDIGSDLYELGSLMGLDPELHEDLQELEDICSAIDECSAAVIDIDDGVDSATGSVLEAPGTEIPALEPVGNEDVDIIQVNFKSSNRFPGGRVSAWWIAVDE